MPRKKRNRIFSIQCKFQVPDINQQKMGQCYQILFNHLFQILIFFTFYNYKLIKQVKMRIFILFSLVLLVYPWSIESSAQLRKDGLHISDQKSLRDNQINPNQEGETNIEVFKANLKMQTETIPPERKDEHEGKIINQNRVSKNGAEQNNQDKYSKQNFVQNKKKIIQKYGSKFNEIDMKYREYLEKIKPSGLRSDLSSNPSSRTEAMIFREHNYLNNLKQINLHNSKKDKSYTMGLTKFTDLNHQQFQSGYIQGGPIRRKLSIVMDNKTMDDQDILLYANVNLTDNCGPIYQSGKCSSAYAFSALDAIWVTHNFIKKQKLEGFFSVQQIISCMKVPPIPNQEYGGCQGGRQIDVYKYVIQNGITTEDQYPYNLNSKEYGQNFDCEKEIISRRSKKYKKVVDYRLLLTKNNCVEAIKKLQQNIVLSVLIISSQKLKDYKEGIYLLDQLPQNLVYHCVLLIGYSHQNGFLVKNSWGKAWGFSGYGYVSQSSGICQYPSYPILLSQ